MLRFIASMLFASPLIASPLGTYAMAPEPKEIAAVTTVEGDLLRVKISGVDAKQIYASLVEQKRPRSCLHQNLVNYAERNQHRVICAKSKVDTYYCDLTYSLKTGQLQSQKNPCVNHTAQTP